MCALTSEITSMGKIEANFVWWYVKYEVCLLSGKLNNIKTKELTYETYIF